MNKLKKHLAVILILALATPYIIYRYFSKDAPHVIASHPIEGQESLKTIGMASGRKSASLPNPEKQKQVIPKTVERFDNPIEDEIPVPKEFKTIKKGVEIVSVEDQPIPELFKEMTRNIKKQMEAQGYTGASEDEVIEIERYLSDKNKKSLKPLSKVADKLTFDPTDLKNVSYFKEGRFLGAIQGGVYVDGRWTGLTR